MIKNSRQRAARAAIVAMCGAALAFSGPVSALAQVAGPDATVNASIVSLINPASKGSLTINKFLGDPTGQPNNGTEQDVAGTPYEAEFKVYKVNNLDPTSISGWESYSKLDAKNIDKSTLGAPVTVTTTNGKAVLSDLDLGFYYVEETPAAGRTTIAPFLAAVPMTDLVAGNPNVQWRYDVQTYPKNQELTVTKSVVDKGMNIGDTVDYTIKGDVPAANPDKTKMFNYYQLTDVFENKEIAPDLDTVSVSLVGGASTVNLTKDTDYVLSEITVDGTDANKSQFSMNLTKSGLKKLTEAREASATVKVQMDVSAKLTALVDGDEINEARLTAPGSLSIAREDGTDVPPPPTDTPDVPPSTVVSKHGKISVTKVDGNDKNTKLENADFELYKCAPGTTNILNSDKDPVSVNGVSKWTTAADGTFTIDGVQLEDWNNGSAVEDTFDYCLVETKAPSGFELNPKPIPVSVTTKSPAADGVNYTQVAEVLNFPNNGGFRLPETGAVGVMGLILVGGAVAGTSLVANRRKDSIEKELSV